MTLVLTELTETGIAMAADSAITTYAKGKVSYNVKQWQKLFAVNRQDFRAGVSYWGSIGSISGVMEFPLWLKRRLVAKSNYSDLPSLAQYLADEINKACSNKPLPAGCDVGLHVTGYHTWSDGVARPMLYHVHNAHSHIKYRDLLYGPSLLAPAVKKTWTLVSETMELVRARRNFPSSDLSLGIPGQLAQLQQGFLLRNGDYGLYGPLSEGLFKVFAEQNQFDGCSIPKDASLAARVGLLRVQMETMVSVYEASRLPFKIGRPINSLGLGPDGFVRGYERRAAKK